MCSAADMCLSVIMSQQPTQQVAVSTRVHVHVHAHTRRITVGAGSCIVTDWPIRLHAPTISFHLGTNERGRKENIVKVDGRDSGC